MQYIRNLTPLGQIRRPKGCLYIRFVGGGITTNGFTLCDGRGWRLRQPEKCSSTYRLDFMSVIVHFFVLQQRNEPKKMNQGCTLGTPSAERSERGAFGKCST